MLFQLSGFIFAPITPAAQGTVRHVLKAPLLTEASSRWSGSQSIIIEVGVIPKPGTRKGAARFRGNFIELAKRFLCRGECRGGSNAFHPLGDGKQFLIRRHLSSCWLRAAPSKLSF